MGRNSLCLAMMTILMLSPAATIGRAQLLAGGNTNTIAVNGEAEVRVAPDEVILSVGVETFDRDLTAAKSANDASVGRAIAAARRASIASEHIQTDYISIAPRYEDHNIERGVVGYVVRKSIVIRLQALEKFEDLLTSALQAGVTHVHAIEFRTTKLREHRDRARGLALAAARDKAALLAREAGRQAGPVQSIGESSYGYASSYGSWWGPRYGASMQNVVQSFGGSTMSTDSTLAPGQIAIRVSVSASFALQ